MSCGNSRNQNGPYYDQDRKDGFVIVIHRYIDTVLLFLQYGINLFYSIDHIWY